MFWVWLMALITIFLLGWFAYKLFSGGTPKLEVSGGDHGHGHSDDGSGSANDHGGTDSNDKSSKSAGESSGTESQSANNASQDKDAGSTAAIAGAAIASTAAASVAAASAAATTMGSTKTSKQPGPQTAANPIVYENVTSGSAISGSGNGSTGHAKGVIESIAAEDAFSVREMIKILNLRESDSPRLGIDKDQFETLWQGRTEGVDAALVSSVRERLMHMMS